MSKEDKYCAICGRPTRTTHHLIFGYGRKPLADADNIVMSLCDDCHNLAVKPVDRIHGNSMAEKLSKMLGQSQWELKAVLAGKSESEARAEFMERYGRSYL